MEIMKFGVSGGGDFANGGEAGGANRSLGNTDNFDLSFLTNNVARMTIKGSGRVEMTESLQLVSTTTSALGVIYKGVTTFLHDFHHPTGGGAIPQGRNVFLGRSAGNFTMGSTATSVLDSSNNVAIGYLALRDNTIGANNIAAGSLALNLNTTGDYSVAIGYQALRDSTTGHRNMAIGGDALRYNISGTCNVGIGISALRENQTLSYNVCIGYGSGRGVSGLSNIQYCTFLGANAGGAIRTGGNNNICIGYQAGDNITTGATNLIIGYDLNALSATGSNQLNIASTIFGNTSTHRVGINTSTLDEILNLSGAIKLGTSIADTTGAIRWTGTDFEGRTSTAWKSLTSGGCSCTADSRLLEAATSGAAGHSLPRDVNRCMDNATPNGAGGFYVFQSRNAAGTMMDAVQLNGGLEIATTGSEDGCYDVALYRDGTVRVISFNAYLDALTPGNNNMWSLGTSSLGWKDIHCVGTFYGTGATPVKLQGVAPGFWLDETGSGNKGCYVVLDALSMQFQRRAQSFGAYEAAPFRFDLSNGNGTFDGTVTASCGVLTCDHVFEDDYGLLPLKCLAKYVKREKKLPHMTINEGGSYSTATMREEIVEKLEEQTLYILQLHERINILEGR